MMGNFKMKYLNKIIRCLYKPKLPKNPDSRCLVHIGCGDFNDSRYINIDEREMPHVHYVASIDDIDELFPKDSIDLVYTCHMMEHIPHQKLSQIFKKVYVCLKKDGILRISVPDFDTIVKIYKEEESIDSIKNPLMGGQGYAENIHKSVFNRSYLSELLVEIGFKEIRPWDAFNATYHDFDDWSRMKYIYNNKEWTISLNLEAIK